jgi:hypothetical protein
VCCVVAVLAFLGPRAGILVWWLLDPTRWQAAFNVWVWPLVGSLFLPWTTLAYVLVAGGGVRGLDWLLLIVAVISDLSMYGGGRYSRRRRRR